MNTKILLLVMYLLAWGCYSQAHGSMPRISYESREGMLAEASCDTSRMIPDVMLKDVIVRGQLVQMKTDRIIYHVDADSSAMKENLIETLRKMPGLIVSRKGEISADDNRKIVYKLNGLRDPLVNNPIELLSALNSKYVKKVELVTHPDLQYGKLQPKADWKVICSPCMEKEPTAVCLAPFGEHLR